MIKHVSIYTDGACSGNPGPGGWAALLCCGGVTKEFSGAEYKTTNNRMELLAAIKALESLQGVCTVTLYTDSTYVKQGITRWIHQWKRNGWRTAARQAVKNADLWRELDELQAMYTIEWQWVKAHAGHKENERVDTLAKQAINTLLTQKQKSNYDE